MSVSFTAVKLIPIKNETEKDIQVCFSRSFLERLGIDNSQILRISFGKISKLIKIRKRNISPNEIHLSETMINELLIPLSINKFLVKYIKANHTLYLGPVVALLTDALSNQEEEPNFRSIHVFCEELQQRITELGGLFYVFRIHDLDGEDMSGYYCENGKWLYSKLPLPDVIYNRVHSRRLEQIELFTSFRSFLEQKKIPLFNDRFLSKWEIHQYLIQENELHPFLPETCIFSHESLYDLINKYNVVFIKPAHGSQGKNIIKLINEADSVLCQTSQQPDSKKYKKNELFLQLRAQLSNKIYIVQQGVHLIHYQDRAMDFRVLVHKNQLHSWKVTSIVARISAEQQFVSNLAKGGEVMKPFNALNSYFDKGQSSRLISAMKELSIQAADTVSRHTDGVTGELGIDIGVDSSGGLWIIEINSKPSKSFEDTMMKIRPSAKAIIQFCTLLAFDENVEMEENI